MVVDVVVAVGVTALVQVGVWRGSAPDEVFANRPVSSLLLLVVTASLLVRRRSPLVVAAVLATGLVLQAAVTGTFAQSPGLALCTAVALYSVGAWADVRRAVAGGLLIALSIQLKSVIASPAEPDESVFVSLFWWLFCATLVGAGVLVRSLRQSRVLQLEERAREVEREAHERAAVVEERQRMARELHDVVAHNVSASILQAGAAEELLRRDPDRAAEALESIQAVGREALGEMRRLVGIMRTDNGEPAAPQPRLADLPALVERARVAGLETELLRGDPATPLAPGVELSAYRIVQEALTNVRRHAAADHAVVTVRYADAWVEVDVSDDGNGLAVANDGTGHGLVGMRERVELFGGEFSAGPGPSGGFTVRARFPNHRTAT